MEPTQFRLDPAKTKRSRQTAISRQEAALMKADRIAILPALAWRPSRTPEEGEPLNQSLVRDTEVMADEANDIRRLLASLNDARGILLDERLNCVDRVNSAWSNLRKLTSDVLPPSLRPDWIRVAGRASRLATNPVVPYSLAQMDEAGDIGTIFLLIGDLLQHSMLTWHPELAEQNFRQRKADS